MAIPTNTLLPPKSPNLPIGQGEYSRQYQDQFTNALRIYFNQLDNPGSMLASTQNINNDIVTALSFSQPDPTTPGALRISLPTQVDQAAGRLKTGDVYYDTTSFVLKVAP